MVDEHTEPLTAEEEAAVSGLPSGSALLIVQRGATPAPGSWSTPRSRPDGTRTPTSSSTTSRCRAATPPSPGPTSITVVKDLGSLNGTYVNRI